MSGVDPTAKIHSTAIIEEGARVGAGSSVGAYSIIAAGVELGRDNRIGPHVVLSGNTRIGDGNEIFQFASIGAVPQDLKYHGEESLLEIGDLNKIREYVTLQPGTEGGGMLTRIGSRNLFMACSHVGHDGRIGDGNVVANSAALAGHVTVGNHVIVGGLVGVHQFVRIGDHAMVGAGAMVAQDIPPYCMAQGDHARLIGLNQIGLARQGWSKPEIALLRKLYRRVFYGGGLVRQRISEARLEFAAHAWALSFLDFIAESQRGVARPGRAEAQASE
jgi:UDP-N-acetylglucosamine acyltransferase